MEKSFVLKGIVLDETDFTIETDTDLSYNIRL